MSKLEEILIFRKFFTICQVVLDYIHQENLLLEQK